MEGRIRGFDEMIRVLNCYGPYSGRQQFWEAVGGSGILQDPFFILGGHLNLILDASEVWGSFSRLDPLSNSFCQFFQKNNLIDVVPSLSSPTWRNGRVGEAAISKILYMFL